MPQLCLHSCFGVFARTPGLYWRGFCEIDCGRLTQGGDYTKIQSTTDWIASTNNSEFWRVIEVDEAIPVVDMLPDPVKSTVKTLMMPLLGQ